MTDKDIIGCQTFRRIMTSWIRASSISADERSAGHDGKDLRAGIQAVAEGK
jgi:hypothetical protein